MARVSDLPTVTSLGLGDIWYVEQAGVSKQATLAQLLALIQSDIPSINVLDYGALGDGVTNDSVSIQNAFNAAYDLGIAKVVFPRTTQSRYMFNSTVSNTQVPKRGSIPTVSSVNTATDTVTFDVPHLLQTGDPVMFQGYQWGGMTVKTQYYALYVGPNDIKLYDTRAHAIAAGATGLIDCTSGVTTTGSINNGSNQLTLAATLNAEKGTCVKIAGVVNSNGGIFIRSLAGSVATINANSNATVGPTAAVTFVSEMDWRYYRTGFFMDFGDGVTCAKLSTFSGTSLIAISDTHSVGLRGGRFEGLTPDLASGIVSGDDLLRFKSNRLLYVNGTKMYFAGDGALRVSTSENDATAATASHPNDGIGSSLVWVERCYTYACHQWSTTINDYMHGGASEVYYDRNVFDNLRGSCKLASRTQGASNLFLTRNTFKNGLDKGFEIDSYSNILGHGNIFQNQGNSAIFVTPNNGPAALVSGDGSGITGFEFNYLKLYDNYFIGCSTNANIATIRMNMDLYSDGFRWDYTGVDISRNHFVDQTNSSSLGVNVLGSSVQHFNIKDNEFINFNGTIAARLFIRGSVTPGFVNNINVSGNTFEMLNAASSGVWVQQSGGTEFINEVHLNNNKFYGTMTANYVIGNCKNVFIDNNRANMTTGHMYETVGGLTVQELHVNNNRCETASTSGWQLNRIDGLYLDNNVCKTSGGATFSIGNDSSNVWFAAKRNRSVGGTANTRQVPVNSMGIGVTGRDELGSTAPTSGTWRVGDKVMSQTAASGQPMGFYCTVKGTAGAIGAVVTGVTDGLTNTFIADDVTRMAVGAFINLVGAWTGGRTITAINQTTLAVTVDGAVPTAATGIVTYVNPTFVNLANLA